MKTTHLNRYNRNNLQARKKKHDKPSSKTLPLPWMLAQVMDEEDPLK